MSEGYVQSLALFIIVLLALAIFSTLFSTQAYQTTTQPWKDLIQQNVETLVTGILILLAVGGFSIISALRDS